MDEKKQVQVEELPGTAYSRILTYPINDEATAKARVRELSGAGVTSLRFNGRTLIDGIPVLGKGCVGIVTEAVFDGRAVALKIRRSDADRVSLTEEGRLLRLANSVDVGPQLVTATRNFLIMQLVDGLSLFRWAKESTARRVAVVRNILYYLLISCFRLDAIGLDHGELSHAPKNVLIDVGNRPFIVDFETASTVRRPANVTSLLQYFMFGQISAMIRAHKLFPRRRQILQTLSQYKKENSVENFQTILDVLHLS